MTMPTFKTNSKPTLTQEAFQEKVNSQGGKFIKEPGTYDLMIKAAQWFPEDRPVDSTWINAKFELENVDGKSISCFLRVPTTAENDYLYGPKKSVREYEDLQKFLRGFGVVLDFDNAISQIAEIFGDLESLVGKTVKARVGYRGTWLRYLGKTDAGVNQYQWTNKDGTVKDETIFSDYKAAEAYAAEQKMKVSGFANILDYFSPESPTIVLGATSSAIDVDLPF